MMVGFSKAEAAAILCKSIRSIEVYARNGRIRKGINGMGDVAFCRRSVELHRQFREA